MKPKPNWLLRFCIGLLALAFLCLALTPVVIRYGLKQRLGPERYAELRAFFDDPVSVPEEWREPKEFPADLVEAASQDIEFRNHQDIPHELNKLLFDISNGDTQLTPDVIYRIGPY
ncbi:MAG: hypothetical protein H6751_18300, partial [Candidatus Omnitrophica bacterium]|nr:hypothetical protein [Candidatus Omnitrophota bacterium]